MALLVLLGRWRLAADAQGGGDDVGDHRTPMMMATPMWILLMSIGRSKRAAGLLHRVKLHDDVCMVYVVATKTLVGEDA